MTTVSDTIDSAHVHPLSAPNTGDHRLWNSTSRPETTQYSGRMMAPPMATNGSQMLSGTSSGIRSNNSHLVREPARLAGQTLQSGATAAGAAELSGRS